MASPSAFRRAVLVTYRESLRRSSQLFDPVARWYVYNRITSRYRQSSAQLTASSASPAAQEARLLRGVQALQLLRQATQGSLPALTHILQRAYGEGGRVKYLLQWLRAKYVFRTHKEPDLSHVPPILQLRVRKGDEAFRGALRRATESLTRWQRRVYEPLLEAPPAPKLPKLPHRRSDEPWRLKLAVGRMMRGREKQKKG